MSCANNELGILARRKIEAEIIKPIYQILVREIGKVRAQAVIGEAIENAAIAAGKAVCRTGAARRGSAQLRRLAVPVGKRRCAARRGDQPGRTALRL